MRIINKLLILGLFFITIFNFYPASGNTIDPGDEIDIELKEEWKGYERKVEIQLSNDQLKIDSTLKEGESKDKILYEIRPENDQVRIELKYLRESNGTDIGFEYRVEFDEIIEYVENGSLIGYQQGEGVSTYLIGDAGWTDFKQSTLILNQTTNEKVELFNVATLDGVFNLTFKVSDSILKLNGTVLTPNSIKLDVEINQYPNTTSNSLLALKTNVETKFNQEKHENSFEEDNNLNSNVSEIRIGNPTEQSQGYFSWSENSLADGQIIDVHNSPLIDNTNEEEDLNDQEKSFKTYFSFLKTDSKNIYWDPTYAVIDTRAVPVSGTTPISSSINTSIPQSTSAIPGFEFWSIFVLLGFSLILRRRLNR